MKKKICLTVAALFIVALSMLSVQAAKYHGEISLDDLMLMSAQGTIQSGYPMGCNYAWEGFFCTDQGSGEYCMRGSAAGEFCNDGKDDIVLKPA